MVATRTVDLRAATELHEHAVMQAPRTHSDARPAVIEPASESTSAPGGALTPTAPHAGSHAALGDGLRPQPPQWPSRHGSVKPSGRAPSTSTAVREASAAASRTPFAWRLSAAMDGPGTADAFVSHTNARFREAWGGHDGVYERLKKEWHASVAEGRDMAGFIVAGTSAQGDPYFRTIRGGTQERAETTVSFLDPTQGPDALGPHERVVGTYVVHGAWQTDAPRLDRAATALDDAFVRDSTAFFSGGKARAVPSVVIARNPSCDEIQMWDVERPGDAARQGFSFLRPLQNFDDLAGDKVPGDDRAHASPAPSLLMRYGDVTAEAAHVETPLVTPTGNRLVFPMLKTLSDPMQQVAGVSAWQKTKAVLGVRPADYGIDASTADIMRHILATHFHWLAPRAGKDDSSLSLDDLENWYVSRLMGDPSTHAAERIAPHVRRDLDQAVTYFMENPSQLPLGPSGACTLPELKAAGVVDPLALLSDGASSALQAFDAIGAALAARRLVLINDDAKTAAAPRYSVDSLRRAVSDPAVGLEVKKQIACVLLPRNAALLKCLDRSSTGKLDGIVQLPPTVAQREALSSTLQRMQREGYELVWNEEFYQPGLKRPNPNLWAYDIGDGRQTGKHRDENGNLIREPWNRWGNKELQHYTGWRADKPNAFVDDGALTIVARREQYGASDYTSARLNTRGTMAFGPNHRLEFEASLAGMAKGGWAALWTLGSNFNPVSEAEGDQDGWPACGELDLMEYAPNNRQQGWSPSRVSTAAHAYGAAADWCPNTQVDFDPTAAHTFAMEWIRDESGQAQVVTLIDDRIMHTFTEQEYNAYLQQNATDPTWRKWFPDASKLGNWPFTSPARALHLIMNVAVGGNLGGSVYPPMGPWQSEMTVHSVRVFKKHA